MQTVLEKPFGLIVLIIVILIAVYFFSRPKKKEEKKENPNKAGAVDGDNYDLPAIVAAIAVMMEGKAFTIKRVILTGTHEKFSSWKHFGRQEIMRRRSNMHE
jgi:hypothetical protein